MSISTPLSSPSASIRHILRNFGIICIVLKRISTQIKKINERYPHFDVVIIGDYMSRPVVNKIVKDVVICFFFFWAGVLY